MNRAKRDKLKGEFASIFEREIWDDARARNLDVQYESDTLDYFKRASRGAKCKDCGSSTILIPGKYTPDFKLNGRIYIEAKGFFKPEKRRLMEDFIRSRPDIQLRFIFAQDNWITKKKKHKYSDWATKQGLIYVIGKTIPYLWTVDTVADNGVVDTLAKREPNKSKQPIRRNTNNVKADKGQP